MDGVDHVPSLKEMVDVAIRRLKMNKHGFFLMVSNYILLVCQKNI